MQQAKSSLRKSWEMEMATLAKKKANQIDSLTLANAVRSFVFFFSWKKDAGRISRMCKLLYQSIRAPLPNNYYAFLTNSGSNLETGMVQVKKLIRILLFYVSERMESKGSVCAPLALLYFLVDSRQMTCLETLSKETAGRLRKNHLRIIKHLVQHQSNFYESMRLALVKLASDPQEKVSKPKAVVAMIFALALRPLTVLPATPSQDNKSQPTSPSPHAQFACRILSIRLLLQNLDRWELSRLAVTITAPGVWYPLLAALPQCEVPYLKWAEGSADGKSVPRAVRIVGNVLQLGLPGAAKARMGEKLVFFGALEYLLRQLDSIGVVDAGLSNQLSLFQDKKFLDMMCVCAKELPPKDCHVIYKLCGSLAFKFKSSKTAMLNAMVFSSSIIEELYRALQTAKVFELSPKRWNEPLREVFSLFCICYNHLLVIQDDAEFFQKQKPCTLHQITGIVKLLRNLLSHLYWEGTDELDPRKQSTQWTQIRSVATQLFKQLRVRQSRKQFCDPDIWMMPAISFNIFQNDLESKQITPRAPTILRQVPFVLTFQQRVHLLYKFIGDDRKHMDGIGVHFQHGTGVGIRVRRDRMLMDGFDSLTKVGQNEFKGRVQVQFINQHGIAEAGIDGGGLFKEFITELLRSAFDPQLGLFRQTPREFTYPNPTSHANPNFSNHLAYFRFVGMIVGKCLYEGIIIEPQFANFFLRKLLGERNYVDDLGSLDPEVYKNLLYLKKNSAENLGLTFCVTRDVFGQSQVVDLIPNGSKLAVNDKNRLRFIYEMADFKLNREIAAQSKAFVAGLNSIIRPDWLKMFEAEELDRLISGTPVIDVKDLKENTNYAGGYDANHELIRWFWSIFDNDFDEKERRAVLKFATSVSRSPLLGFRHLYPKFCIQRSSGDSDNLPTSSTCMNLLKLPRYHSKEKLLEKLRYSIKSSSGFYLT